MLRQLVSSEARWSQRQGEWGQRCAWPLNEEEGRARNRRHRYLTRLRQDLLVAWWTVWMVQPRGRAVERRDGPSEVEERDRWACWRQMSVDADLKRN